MPVIYVRHFTRAEARLYPERRFVFGDNVARIGYRGQAAELRDEPNAIGIPTRWRPGRQPDTYFDDKDFPLIISKMIDDVAQVYDFISAGGVVHFPADGIGTGYAHLPTKAPRVWAWLNQILGLCGIDAGGLPARTEEGCNEKRDGY